MWGTSQRPPRKGIISQITGKQTDHDRTRRTFHSEWCTLSVVLLSWNRIWQIWCSFIENPTTAAVQAAGRPCGLLSGDWLRATRWVNLPESSKFGANGTCKSLIITFNLDRDVCRTYDHVEKTWQKAREETTQHRQFRNRKALVVETIPSGLTKYPSQIARGW